MVVVVVDLGLYKYSKVSKNINYKGFMLMTTLADMVLLILKQWNLVY